MEEQRNEVDASQGVVCPSCRGCGYISEMIALGPPTLPVPPEPPRDGWLTMKQAAAKCRCSLFWFSRNWKEWGLHPSHLGRFLFDEKEIEKLLNDHRISRRGRPRKVRGLGA